MTAPAPARIAECLRHPGTETALRCQRCDTPICPRCMVQSPVGAKCPDCAKVMKSPIYTVSLGQFTKAALVAVVGGVVMGLAWILILLPLTIGYLSILFGAGLGYAFTRLLEWASGRKRGPVMVGLAIAGILIAWGMTVPFLPVRVALYGLVAVGVGVYFSYQNLK